MREAVIVSTARTPIGRAFRGAFNASPPPMLGGHAIKHAVERAGIDGAEVDDVVWGAALQQGGQAPNIAPPGAAPRRAADERQRPVDRPPVRRRA